MSEAILEELTSTPAWPNGARVAIEAHRTVLERLEDLEDVLARRLRLRFAELLYGAGTSRGAIMVRAGMHPPDGHPAEVRRLAFLDARLAGLAPEGWPPAPHVDAATPLEVQRVGTVRAESAFAHGQFDEAARAWELVRGAEAQGFWSDELRFLAARGLARLALLEERYTHALDLLQEATGIARRLAAPHDEAGLLLYTWQALVALGRTEGLIALGERAEGLPRVDLGGLPEHLVHHLKATGRAGEGDARAAVRALEAGIRDLDPSRDPAGWAALMQAKATVLEAVGRDYHQFRTLILGRHRLARCGAEYEASLFDPLVDLLRDRVGEHAWRQYTDRLKQEVAPGDA